MDRDAAHAVAATFVDAVEQAPEDHVSESVSMDDKNAALEDLQDGVFPE